MKVVDRLKDTLDNPALFNLVQFAISGPQNGTRRRIREGLQLQPGERLLDVCCGTGEFADVALGDYLGIDINPKYIEYAAKKYGKEGGHPEREFLAADISALEFSDQISRMFAAPLPKAMMINSMHHLTVEQNDGVLAGIARVLDKDKGRLVIIDMNPTPSNPVSKFLADQDRGDYIRPLAEQVEITRRHFEIEKADYYYSGLCGQTIIVCHTKK